MTALPWSPGEWRALAFAGLYQIVGGNDDDVARVGPAWPPQSDATAQANARLIAAAPDLYGALAVAQLLLVAAYGEPDGSPMSSKSGENAIRLARAALAKALG